MVGEILYRSAWKDEGRREVSMKNQGEDTSIDHARDDAAMHLWKAGKLS